MISTAEKNDLRADRHALHEAIRAAGGEILRGDSVRCPNKTAHNNGDRNPSASVYQSEGVYRLKCHACGFGGDIFDVRALANGTSASDELTSNVPSVTKRRKTFPSPEAATAFVEQQCSGELVCSWTYSDRFLVARFDLPDGGKTYRPISRNGAGWRLADPPGLLPLYRLGDLDTVGPVFVAEGEKCVDIVRKMGLTATTSAHGAKSPHKSDWSPLAGRDVVIIPDAGSDGRKYAEDVADRLLSLNPSAKVKIVDLPSLNDGEDVEQWVAAIGNSPLAASELTALAEDAPFESSTLKTQRVDETKLVSVPASQLVGGEAIEWEWFGFLAKQSITLLTAFWKAGKTTLVTHFLKSRCHGGSIAGEVTEGKTLVVTEEGSQLWVNRRDALGLTDDVHFIVQPFIAKPNRLQWERAIEDIVEIVKQEAVTVVVLDTFANIAPVRDENDAAQMQEALMPLRSINQAGAAILIVHHSRKGDGREAQSSRGSSALPAMVDTILELRRYDPNVTDDTRRTLRGFSRFEETPQEKVLNLNNGEYVDCGTPQDARRIERLEIIAEILTDADGPLRPSEIKERWPEDAACKAPAKSTLAGDLSRGHSQELWQRYGSGVRNDPFLYESFDSSTQEPKGLEETSLLGGDM